MAQRELHRPEGKYRVLVVEDNQVDQMAFRRMIKMENLSYDYTIAGSVAEARELLDRNDFEVIIADYFLGDGTAFDIFEAAGETPIIIATGTGDEEIAVRAMKNGAYDYLTDENDRIILTNPAFVHTYGYDEKEVIGQPTDFLWVEQSDLTPAAIPHQTVVEGEFHSQRKDGSVFPITLSRSVITDDNGTKLACLGVIRDITRRKRIEEDLP